MSNIELSTMRPFDQRDIWGNNSKHVLYHVVEQDIASLFIKTLDVSTISFTDTLEGEEETIHGNERKHRLEKQGVIRLDARLLVYYIQHPDLFPDCFKHVGVEPEKQFVCTTFDGTVLSDVNGVRVVPALEWNRLDEDWRCVFCPLDYIWWDKAHLAATIQGPRRFGQNASIVDVLSK